MAQIGYHAIGSGGAQALQSMIGFSQASFKSLGETVFAVYASKRRAEVAPGVGKDTDLALIDSKGIRRFGKTELETLEGVYQEYLRPIQKDAVDKITEMVKRIKHGQDGKGK